MHEGPQGISKNNKVILKEGMVLSNEPGYYEKNKFGIRIENLIYVKKEKSKKIFENLTMAPIEKELIDKKILNENEKKWLNNYHNEVFRILKKSMNKSEIQDLKKKLVQLFKILFHSSSNIILTFRFLALSILVFVGFVSPTIRKSSFFDTDPKTFPP